MTGDADPAPTAAGPQVSVVLICYNDEERLPVAIESARDQSLTDIEIIVVDHGSTDGSVAVARTAAGIDPRIRVIELGDNEGKPGRPINAGIRAATAPWITIFASDDVLRPHACENMLTAATTHGADIVVGSLQRVNMDTGEVSRWMPSVTLRSRVLNSLGQLPELIRDTTGGGKLYNADFIRTHDLSFPEDIYYQDQVFTLRYYAYARTVSILSRFVLDWRHWPSGQASVTQRRSSLENLSDRFSANELIDEFLIRENRQDLMVLKQRKFLQHDLSIHVKDLAGTTPEYRRMLVGRTDSYVSGFLPESFVGLPMNKRLMLNCIRADRLADAEQVTTVPFNRLTATWDRATAGDRQFVVPPWGEDRPDPVFDVTGYRLDEIPLRFQPARVECRAQAAGQRIEFTVSLRAPGRTGTGRPRTVELILADTSQGNRMTVALKARRAGTWTGSAPTRALDVAFGGEPGPVDVMSVFDAATPGRWSAQVHPPDDQPESQTAGAWSILSVESDLSLQREPGEIVRHRFDGVRRTQPTETDPACAELLNVSDAREYLKASEIEPQPDRAFFESFAGRRIADGPLMVSQRMHQRRSTRNIGQFWSCTPWAQLDVPGYATPAPRFSIKYLDALAASAIWFDNGWLPFRPGEGRRLIQLWHGVPLVRPPASERSPVWRAVASSGPYFEDRLSGMWPDKTFRFAPTGSPRTDPLLAPDAARRRTELRQRWGLTDRTVVLFSPALRDNEVATGFRQPDLHRVAADLGSEFFWVHREHDDDATGRRTSGIADDLRWFASTASGRVDIIDYLLMADVLVTDYASVVTDFALTGRPIIHLVTDMEFFEQVNPGTYFSLTDGAAGPVVTDDAALVKAIRAATADPAPATERDADLVARLAPLDANPQSADELLDWVGL